MDTGDSNQGSNGGLTQQWAQWFKEHLAEGAQKSAQNMTSAAWLKTIEQLKASVGQVYDGLGDALGERSSDPEQIKALEARLALLERQVAEIKQQD